jgi:hypothetical protein
MATDLVGIHYILSVLDLWVIILILWVTTDVVMYILRDKLEGLGYQVSYSAKIGDGGIVIAVFIAATILHRNGTYVPGLLQNSWLQIGIFMACVGLGLIVNMATLKSRSGRIADVYHDIIIAPAILFFAITLLPVIWYNARWYEAVAVILAAIVWAWLVRYDVKHGRLNQRQWLVRHGFSINGEPLKQ